MKKIPAFIKKLSLLCWTKPRYKHLLFFILTLVIVCSYGYYFGTFDQSSHIPFLKKTIDSSLYPNDHFFDLSKAHYSYFWLLFVPFYKLGILELSMFLVYLATTYITFWALWSLSKTLFHNPLTSLLAVVASAFPHMGFFAFPLFEFSLLNRTAVLPFEIIAFRFYFKKNYVATFLILGILYNFHALSVHFVLAMVGMDMLFSLIQKRDYKAFLAAPFFFIAALPVLIWKFSHSGTQMSVQWEWFHFLNVSTFFHLFNFVSVTNPAINLLTAGGISALILFFIAKKMIPKNDLHDKVAHFMYGGIFILLIQQIATIFFPLTIIIQAQIIRIGIFLTFFSYLYMSHMVSIYKKSKTHFICFVTTLFLSISPLVLLLSLIFWRVIHTKILKIVILSVIIIFLTALYILKSFNFIRPGIHIWPEKTAFYDIQIWAKTHTPRTTRFITPPAKWGLYDVEWRVGSERSTISTLSELLEGAFDPSYISYWKPRFEDIAPNAIKQFKGDYLANPKIANNAYYNHSTEQFIALGRKYHASYLVVDRKNTYSLPITYQNKEYTVYSLNTP